MSPTNICAGTRSGLACVAALLVAQTARPQRQSQDVLPRPEDAAKVEWLAKNALQIRSIDPEDDNFADLAPLKKILGDARVVQLGESSHGDGATLYAKQRLIRFLHQEMGFDVLAWESGFFDCEEMNGNLASDMPILLQAARRGVYAIWTGSALMAPVFEYTRSTLRTSRPLRHTGFDIRGAQLGYLKRLFEFMDTLDPKVGSADDRDRITKLLAGMGSPYHPSHEQREKGRAALSRVLDGVRSRGPAAKNSREIMFFSDHCCAPLCSRVLSAMSKWLSKLDRQFRCPVLHGCDVSEYDSGNCAGALGALRDSCFYKLLILNVFLGLARSLRGN